MIIPNSLDDDATCIVCYPGASSPQPMSSSLSHACMPSEPPVNETRKPPGERPGIAMVITFGGIGTITGGS